jgi:hypothetical protein
MKLSSILLILSSFVFICCNQPQSKQDENVQLKEAIEQTDTKNYALSYTSKEASKVEGNCDMPDKDCATIKFQYLEFQGAAQEKLNKVVKDFLFDAVVETDKKDLSMEDVMNEYIDSYKQAKKESKSSNKKIPLRFGRERVVSVTNETSQLITLKMMSYEFEGGAKPNINTFYKTYFKENGNVLALSDLFTEDYKITLNTLGEKQFRKKQKIAELESLKNAGYDFEHNQFAVNENFALEKDSILFLYNTDEIASPALGAIELKIAYKELKSIFKNESLLE